VLLDAIGDVDLDKHIPVKQQPNMVKSKAPAATEKTEKTEKTETKKGKKKCKE
jgi:hypothetical protein